MQYVVHIFKRILANTSDKLVSVYLMPKEKLFNEKKNEE